MRFIDLTVEPDPSSQSVLTRRLIASNAVVREELLNWRMSEDFILNLLSFVHGDPEVYAAIHAEAPDVLVHEIRAVDDDRFYAYVQQAGNHAASWWTAFLAHDFIHVPPVVLENGIARITLLGEVDELRDVVADLSKEVSVEIDAVGDYHGQGRRITDRLTTRQYRALRVAADCGYYTVPREGSLADVAAELNCTESTVSDLLRRAEREIVDAILGT